MERPNPGMPRILAALAALMLVAVACGPAAEEPGAGTPPAEGTPATGTPPAEGTPPGEATPPAEGTPPGEESPPAEGTPPGEESPPAEGTPPGEESPAAGTPGAQPTFENIGGDISIMAVWLADEEESFRAMIEPWVEQTGVNVQYQGTRELTTLLTSAIQGGGAGLPDVAGIPGPGLMEEWFAQGALQPLDFIDLETYRSDTPPGFADLGTVDGQLAGIFTKAAVKGLIWYNTEHYDGTEPENFDALQQMDPAPAESLWCLAFESGGDSGWPGTDWVEDIVLRQSGPDVYDAWLNGEHPWTSEEIRSAFVTLGEVIERSAGGGQGVVTTNFTDGGNGLFTDPPECLFHHQASFITDFFVQQGGAEEGQFDFFRMPDIDPQHANAVTGGGDLFGMFRDTPQARSLMQYLLTPQAQQIWVERGGFISANRNVPLDVYPDDVSRKSAEMLQEAEIFRFDASDLMPGAMNDAFWQAMMSFPINQGNLDSILENLDSVQQDAYEE